MKRVQRIGHDWTGAAVISPCELYRYTLERNAPMSDGRFVLWVMLNPSTADATKNDNTIRRCISYTAAWGYSSLRVVNLYAYRTSQPAALRSFVAAGGDAVGPDNNRHIGEQLERAGLIVAAWGSTGPEHARRWEVMGICHRAGKRLHYLRLNHCQDASMTREPSHPLRLARTLRPIAWDFMPDRGPGAGA